MIMRAIFRSRTGYILSALNVSAFIFAFWEGGIPESGIHPFHEPVMIQIFLLLNLPSLLFAGVFLIPSGLWVFGLQPDSTNAWLQQAIWLVAIWFQWQILGFLIDKFLFGRYANGSTDVSNSH